MHVLDLWYLSMAYMWDKDKHWLEGTSETEWNQNESTTCWCTEIKSAFLKHLSLSSLTIDVLAKNMPVKRPIAIHISHLMVSLSFVNILRVFAANTGLHIETY